LVNGACRGPVPSLAVAGRANSVERLLYNRATAPLRGQI